jgi:hypothetical protein
MQCRVQRVSVKLTAGFQVMEDSRECRVFRKMHAMKGAGFQLCYSSVSGDGGFQGVQGFPQNACNAGCRVSVVLTAGFQVMKDSRECRVFRKMHAMKGAGFQFCLQQGFR